MAGVPLPRARFPKLQRCSRNRERSRGKKTDAAQQIPAASERLCGDPHAKNGRAILKMRHYRKPAKIDNARTNPSTRLGKRSRDRRRAVRPHGVHEPVRRGDARINPDAATNFRLVRSRILFRVGISASRKKSRHRELDGFREEAGEASARPVPRIFVGIQARAARGRIIRRGCPGTVPVAADTRLHFP